MEAKKITGNSNYTHTVRLMTIIIVLIIIAIIIVMTIFEIQLYLIDSNLPKTFIAYTVLLYKK